MGLLTFSDQAGERWRVWRVESPAAGPHLLDSKFRGGWLVFEREDGQDRRRLAQVPDDWESLPEERLVQLRDAAIRVEAIRTPPGQRSSEPRSDATNRSP